MISIVAAMDNKRGIGKDGGIPWHISEDFKHFKQITSGHPIIMGRKTFESIGQKLPSRTNIVITRDSSSLNKLNYQPDMIVSSLEEAIGEAGNAEGNSEIFIIGGGQIFKEAMEKGIVDRLHLTIIEGDYGADTFFPDYLEFDKVISEEKGKSENYKFKFLELSK